MRIEIKKGYYTSREEAVKEITDRGLHGELVTKKVKVVFGTDQPTDPDKPRHSPDEL